jgi:ABC-type transport system involved in multi-copper enzyme maturation permease subunit
VCLFPALGRLVMLLIIFGVIDFGPRMLRDRLTQSLPPSMEQLNPERAAFYIEPVLAVMPGMIFFLLLTSMVVARSVARDRATNALELYWTRGITPWSYVLGKWWGGFLITATSTVIAPLTLWLAAVFLAEDWNVLLGSAPQFAWGLLALVGLTAMWTAIGTLLSAVCSSANLAMVAWCILLVGTSAIGFILSQALHEPWLRSCLSFWDAGGVLVRAVAGLPQRDASVPGALATLTALFIGLVVAARRRMRVQEALQ